MGVRKTQPVITVALEILTNPTQRHWGYDLTQRTGLKTGVLYPILGRMLAAGWLVATWEDTTPGGRPGRRFYELTAGGAQALEAMVSEASSDSRFTHLIETYTTNTRGDFDE
jgi:PadR family transcriptional regulator PadR